MPATLNPIRKALLKKDILETKGKNIRASMIKAGYSESTAKRTSGNASVKIIQAEIVADIQKKITVDSVLAQLNYIQTLAIQDEDFSTATRCEELKGKWLAMFTEKTEITIIDQPDNQFSLERLSRLNQKAIPQVVGRDE